MPLVPAVIIKLTGRQERGIGDGGIRRGGGGLEREIFEREGLTGFVLL